MYHLYPQHFQKGKVIYCISLTLPVIFLLFILYLHKTRIHGDASIYFTFIRDFFPKPFVFGYEVKHGATSPLWVMLNSIPYYFLGFEKWLVFATYVNKIFILGGVLLNVYICIGNEQFPMQKKEKIFIVLFLILS
ncbi:MAG: hypothetical protein ACP5KS_00235, partial [Candidatus Hydrogenedens sp.]